MDGAPDTKSEQTEQRDGTAPEQIAKKPRVSPELRRELYGLHLAGKTDKELGEIMASRGHPMTRSAIMRARYAGEREAVLNGASPSAPKPQPTPTADQDAPPIIEKEKAPEIISSSLGKPTDDQILDVLIRDMLQGYKTVRLERDHKSHALRIEYGKTIGKLVVDRNRLITNPGHSSSASGKQYTVLASPDDWPDPPSPPEKNN